jgi:hypothetical protein
MEWLFSWEVSSVVVPSLAGAALTFLALDDFKLAKSFFLIAAADASGGVIMWGAKTQRPLWQTSVVVFVMMGSIGILTVLAFRYVEKKREEKQPVVLPAAPFLIKFDVVIEVSPPGNLQPHSGFWITTPYAKLVSPVDILTFLKIVNLQTVPSAIESYALEALVGDEWIKLIRIDPRAGNIYYTGSSFQSSIPIDVSQNALDFTLPTKQLGSHESIAGWAFFEDPHQSGQRVDTFRMTLRDAAGTEFSSIIKPPYSKSDILDPSTMHVLPGRHDISSFKVMHYSDSHPRRY